MIITLIVVLGKRSSTGFQEGCSGGSGCVQLDLRRKVWVGDEVLDEVLVEV